MLNFNDSDFRIISSQKGELINKRPKSDLQGRFEIKEIKVNSLIDQNGELDKEKIKKELDEVMMGGLRHFIIDTTIPSDCSETCSRIQTMQSCYGGLTCIVCTFFCRKTIIFQKL